MARLVTLARSGIIKDTPLGSTASRATPGAQPEPLTFTELAMVRAGQENFVYFLDHVFPLSFEGQMYRQADGTHSPFSPQGDAHPGCGQR